MVGLPQLTEAQTNLWNRIIGALERDISYTKVRDLLKDCAPEPPSAEQYGRLSERLASQGAESPTVQQRWIMQFQCTPVLPTRTPARLEVRTDRAPEPVFLNGIRVGLTPATFDVDSGGTVTLRIGEAAYRVDTTVMVPAERTVIVEVSTSERRTGEPPVRDDVERELQPLFRPVADLPSVPTAPKPPTGGGSFGLGLLMAGAATAASMAPCTTMATAPSPYGGFLGSTYYSSGTVVPAIRYGCAGAAGGSALIVGSMVIHALRKAAFRGTRKRYEGRVAAYREQEAERERNIQSNLRLVDSTMAYRRTQAARTIITRSISVQLSGTR